MNICKCVVAPIVFFQIFLSCSNHSMAGKASLCKDSFDYRKLDNAEINNYRAALAIFFDSLLLNSSNFSGGILVAKNGEVLYERYTGFSDAAFSQPIDSLTPFHVASTSKTFTAHAIMQLVQQAKLNLDDSLNVFFPEFPYPGIKVRNLLNHSSGLPNYANFLAKYKRNTAQTATNADVLYCLFANRPPLEFVTGTRFKYCNTNFLLLALIVEKVSGQKFPEYVQDSIFNPCGMKESYIVSEQNPEKFKISWSGGKRPYNFTYLDGIYGDKNVFTTCRDLLKYDSCIQDNVLLTPQSYQQMWMPNFLDQHYQDTTEFYGLGWRLRILNDSLKIPYHNGWWHGNNAVFQRLIADTAVIIVTGNRMNNKIYHAPHAANIFRHYFDISAGLEEENTGQNDSTNKQPVIKEKKAKVNIAKSRNSVQKTIKTSRKRQTKPTVKQPAKKKIPIKN